MNSGIAIVGMACCYPDAHNPHELWENVLARRRAFRRLPRERLLLQDYFSADPATPDAIYTAEAALIEGYEFDRVKFRVAGPIFRSVDMTHWLALDAAHQALRDAGFTDGNGLPRETTGVLMGNTLTGEFSRAATLRLRWPYVRRVVEARLIAEGWEEKRRSLFLQALEDDYKVPFPPVGEESLAGALSNTIAGRICNYFHLGGGGYTVDGACCSSLLAVARACSALETKEIDVALAGGVDLSLDPFELVGFAKTGALARGEMRIYDRESSGFLPGEGCGIVVLMRARDARAQNLRPYAIIRGWGLSSDGVGSITRPELCGQMLAIRRAYDRAGYGVDTVTFFEGHGTGTRVGDEIELQTLVAARKAAGAPQPAAIGSIKANIGHTKAAAGIAGLLKATLALYHRVLPPTTGVVAAREELSGKQALLRVVENAEPWPEPAPLRAGINSFGFGGINVHVTIEGSQAERAAGFSPHDQALLSTTQDAELFLFDTNNAADLAQPVSALAGQAAEFSYSELSDLSNALYQQLGSRKWRAAVVAHSPAELKERLDLICALLKDGKGHLLDPAHGVFIGAAGSPTRIGFLFPGQASPVRLDGGAHVRRFPAIRDLFKSLSPLTTQDVNSTYVAQLAISTSELAGLRLLQSIGINASLAIGHSLGELAAYCWAGALEEGALLHLVELRGRLMSHIPGPPGAMASICGITAEIESLIGEGEPVVLACFNGSNQTVVAGEAAAITRLISRATTLGHDACQLPASHAFHSPLMAPAATLFSNEIATSDLTMLRGRVISTVTGTELRPNDDLRNLLVQQLTSPVRFLQAVEQAQNSVDLYIEIGPGQVLTHLMNGITNVPTIALDIAGPSLTGVLQTAAAAYVTGAPLHLEPLFSNRFFRPFRLGRKLRFFANPCESAPASITVGRIPGEIEKQKSGKTETDFGARAAVPLPLNVAERIVRGLVARRTELPTAALRDDARLLRDLHLNSIVVAEVVATASRELGVTAPVRPLDFADATLGELAQALERLRKTEPGVPSDEVVPTGVDSWVRAFIVEWSASKLSRRGGPPLSPGSWRVFALPGNRFSELLNIEEFPGDGVIVCLSEPVDEEPGILLEAAHAVIGAGKGQRYFVVTGPAVSVISSFARTLHLEHPEILTRVIEAPLDGNLSKYICQEIASGADHADARYDASGQRSEPRFKLLKQERQDQIPLEPEGVLLVTGGTGIVAECISSLAREIRAKLVILGRSRPEQNTELSDHLKKLAASGIKVKYIPTDVSNPQAVRVAVRKTETALGRIVGIIHGAGCNEPMLLRDLNETALRRTLAPKVSGLKNLLSAVGTDDLRLLVTFGSVIGRIGLRGEAHYALANACLTSLTETFSRKHPACRCLALESSAWSGLGMAERLGAVETLRRGGIATIAPDDGVAWFRRLVAERLPTVAVTLTARLGAAPPLRMHAPPLPLLRFLERPRVYYPGVELVVESEITTASDPYLLDHVFQDQPLLPGVMGLEAMTQAARALTGEERIRVIRDVSFERPIIVEPGTRVTLRIAALMHGEGVVEVVLRSSQTSFAVNHFRCTCDFRDSPEQAVNVTPPPESARLPLEPERDLYGSLMFQRGRFRRLAGYRSLSARSSWAEIEPAGKQRWFSQYLPDTFVLGDPAARDAAVHSVQACVPHAILLPIGVERLTSGRLNANEQLLAQATQRWQKGQTYCYDLALRSMDGVLREWWQGLTLRKVADIDTDSWPDPLLAASLEWRVREMTATTGLSAAFERDSSADRRSRSERAIQKALGSQQTACWSSDGKLQVQEPMCVSAAHADGLTLAIACPQVVTCDLAPIQVRDDLVWRDLLGSEPWNLAQLIAKNTGEDLQIAATRIWTALETLKKTGQPDISQMVLGSEPPGKQGWISLRVADLNIASTIIRFREHPVPVAISILTRGTNA